VDATERRIWTMAQHAMRAAVRGDWKTLASTVLDLDDMGAALAALLVWAGYAAVANAGQHGIPPGAPGFVASFDQARLEQWCAAEGLPDLTAAFRAAAGGNATAASPLFSGAVTAADMTDACRLASCVANGDALTARAIADAASAPGDPGRLARLMTAAVITAVASQGE
jgi:hypothetical protein